MNIVNYLTQNLGIPQYLDFFARIIVACLCGSAIGYERSRRFKNAGLRTHIIVCCASALMMIVSKYAFLDFAVSSDGVLSATRGADPARIAAQVVSGISFLGAGVIFKHGASVKGLTTAAGIWATAGIGLALGAGMYAIGLFSTVVITIIQYVMHKFKFGFDSFASCHIEFDIKGNDNFKSELFKKIDYWNGLIDEIDISDNDDSAHYELAIRVPTTMKTEEIVHFISDTEGIGTFNVSSDI
ncbi:MAG: MgtC/SapB family protein [Clostridia bacterium]|nr:MgtC/SapB family protein [Clostridia bacterium]